MKRRTICYLFALLFFFSLSLKTLRAQQTIFNVPITDVLEPEKVYVEMDASFRVAEPKFSSFVPRIVIGAGHGIEVGLNINGNIQPGPDATTLVPAIKWKIYDGKENGWAFVVGDNFYIPVRNRSYNAGNYFYAEFSKTFSTKTRLTAGLYHFTANVVAPNAQRAGGQFGFEQALTKRFAIQADWFTGKHANGYYTLGGAYKLHPKLSGYFGYALGNSDLMHGNHFFYTVLGYNLN